MRESGRRPHAAMREWEHASLTDLVLLPLLPYLVWAFVYYGKARRAGPRGAAVHACMTRCCLPAARLQSLLLRACK